MIPRLILLALTQLPLALAIATPVAAETRYLAFDPADRITTALTRGVTLEVERGLFGGMTLRRIVSTSARGSVGLERGGPDEARRALPSGATEASTYSLPDNAEGRPLARALCPGAERTFLVVGSVRPVRPFVAQAVGRWSDGTFRHCVTLSYDYRGEWAMPPATQAE